MRSMRNIMDNTIEGLAVAARALVELADGVLPISAYDPTYFPKNRARMALFDLKIITGVDYMVIYGPDYGYRLDADGNMQR
jgi:hypothetical protein